MAQKVAAIGVPSALGAILLGCVIGHFCTNGKELSVVLIGGNEEMQNSVANCLRRRASRKGGNSKVADVLSYVTDEERKQISGESHPLGERFIKFDKWKIHSISADGNGVIIDNPKNSELIGKADVIIVVADDAQSINNIHRTIGKGTANPLYKDGALVVHVGDKFKKLKDVKEKLVDIQEKDFLVPVVNIGNCQHAHSTEIRYGEGQARSRNPFSRRLVLSHLNEALRLNHQGVQFNDKFFQDCVLPQWREEVKASRAALNAVEELSEYEKKQMMSIPAMRQMFNSNKFLKSLKPAANAGYASLEGYIFGPWGGHDKTRIESIKNVDPELYNMFWDELAWINGNPELLDREDANEDVDPVTGRRPPYKNRLINTALDIHGECDTELRSFIESVGDILDNLSLIKQGQGHNAMDKDELKRRILTRVRQGCREDLAQKVALCVTQMNKDQNEGKDVGVAAVPEMQAVIRHQFATALNLPDTKVANGNEQFMPQECGVVYSTNLLSSIMNIEAIASVATNFAKKLDGANKFDELSKNYDCEVSYDECCKIFDRSARHMLKGDKRPFDARFRTAVEKYMVNYDDADDAELNRFSDWMSGRKTDNVREVFGLLTMCDGTEQILPELTMKSSELFGHLTFIKYLADQGYIAIK